jgi:hypothetical protein
MIIGRADEWRERLPPLVETPGPLERRGEPDRGPDVGARAHGPPEPLDLFVHGPRE